MNPLPTAPIVPINITYDDYRLGKLQFLIGKYEIRPDFCQKLRQLENYEIVIICDDSGSMSTIIDDDKNPMSKKMTRWDELKNYVNVLIDISSALDKNGIDIYFLNRQGMYNVSDTNQVANLFYHPPNGYTPLANTIERIYKEKDCQIREKKLLLLIATDGQPTTPSGNIDTNNFFRVLRDRNKNVHISIIACTDDNNTMKYLNNIDKNIPKIDVIDDYKSEKNEILKKQGKSFKFSYGDYIVKTLLGSIDPYFDSLDEKSHDSFCSVM